MSLPEILPVYVPCSISVYVQCIWSHVIPKECLVQCVLQQQLERQAFIGLMILRLFMYCTYPRRRRMNCINTLLYVSQFYNKHVCDSGAVTAVAL